MYLVYNRDYKLINTLSSFEEVQELLGQDIQESNVNSLKFVRGNMVILKDDLPNILAEIIREEKDTAVNYVIRDIENREDEVVELRTLNNQLDNTIKDRTDLLQTLSTRVGDSVKQAEGITGTGTGSATEEAPKEEGKEKKDKPKPKPINKKVTKVKTEAVNTEEEESKADLEDLEEIEGDITEEYTQEVIEEESDLETLGELEGLDNDTLAVLSHIEKNHAPKKPKTRRVKHKKINFINILEGGEIKQINQLKGVNLIKIDPLAKSIGLDTEHIEYIMGDTLKGCGGTPKNLNKTVISPDEAVWIIVSALVKREGYGNDQRFQKTQENAIEFYKSWEDQRVDITKFLK